MNVQAHMSGQLSGQVPNQAGMQLTGLPQQNGHPLPRQMQSLGNFWNSNMDPEFQMARRCIQDKITHILMDKGQTPEFHQRLPDMVRRLEEVLFKDASSKDEYLNEQTLEPRLHSVIRRLTTNKHAQQQQKFHHMNSSSNMGTMIPTPGMSQSGQTVSSSGDHTLPNTNMVTPSTVNSGNLLPSSNGSASAYGGSYSASDGMMANGYQQPPPNMPVGHGTNPLMPAVNSSIISPQMVPTPGFTNSQPLPSTSIENTGGGFSTSEPALMPHQQQTKQYVGSQNSRILHNIGSQMGVGSRSNLQQKVSTYGGFPNGTVNGSLQMTGGNMQLMNGSSVSDGYLNVSSFGNSPKTAQHHFDQQRQQQMMQHGDYGMSSVDVPGSVGLHGPSTSAGSTLNNQMLSHGNVQLKPRNNHGGPPHQQPTLPMRNHVVDQAAKMNFQNSHSNREHILQPQQQLQKFEEQQFQQQQPPFSQFVQHQNPQKQPSQQHQLLVKNNNVVRQSQMISAVDKQRIAEHGIKTMGTSLHPQAFEQYQMPELHNRYQQNSIMEDQTKGMQFLNNSSNSRDFHSSFPQIPHQMQPQQQQIMQPCQQSIDSANASRNFSSGSQADILIQGQWHAQPTDQMQQPSNDQNVQEQFHQRISGEEEAQRPQSMEGGSVGAVSVSSQGALVCQNVALTVNDKREKEYESQRRWLLLLRHAHSCPSPEGACLTKFCLPVRKLCLHLLECKEENCSYPRCRGSKKIIAHHRKCTSASCPVCVHVHQICAAHRKSQINQPVGNAPTHPNGTWRSMDDGDVPRVQIKNGRLASETLEETQPSIKRRKADYSSPSLLPVNDNSIVSVGPIIQESQLQEAQIHIGRAIEPPAAVKGEVLESKQGQPLANLVQVKSSNAAEIKKDSLEGVVAAKATVNSILSAELPVLVKHENVVIEKENVPLKQEFKQESTALPCDSVVMTKSGKPKIKGVSMTELFTPEQIREHIRGLRQWVGQSKAKVERNQAMSVADNENSCQLCGVEKLTFEPPPIYCTPCGARIKRNSAYYTVGAGEARHYFCIPCYNDARGDTIEAEGLAILKAKLEKKKNDEETEEWWVQCDKCERWQHQICALFNGRRNEGGQAEYTCPNCYIMEIEGGERKRLDQSAVLGAKDLPRTILSDHIEQRLAKRLKQERQDRARVQGKSFEEVPGAESLVVRVVSSVDKKLEVKQRFLEIFQEENYPTEFPYKSKVILLFQKIEGVEVCLFGMYVQEFGAECQFPNQRRVYLSYLDSVKYFRPEIKAVTGEALRTFVYHEILIGYLEYCKIRGFTSCYIWACPPLKGEDYILYCHPEIQKTPKSDKLREWYLAMLRKAGKENIVVDLTNLYDHFFVSIGESKAKVTAARLPYFDGDYWPGAAEDMINILRQEEDGRNQLKKGKTKKIITKRALKAAGHTDLSANASKDALLMQKLGETICPMKEDFIMVHLQHACTHCCHLMVSGKRWVCSQCRNFQLCDKCFNAEQKLEDRERHPTNSKEKHILNPVEISDVPADTKDRDDILESEFFDTRQAFLSLCQGNHYQYDTLRRAKHSSIMVLYHLHNPTAPAFVTTCNVCQLDIETGHGWRCEVCPDFDVCNGCFLKGVDHPHKLTNYPSIAERDAQNKEARQKRVQQLRIMLELLVHASQCRSPVCKYPKCRQVKSLFRHGMLCKIRATGGCVLCKRMWYLLQLHARACKESGCLVPRCKDLKEHMRRLQQQSDSRRRAAVMEMMRQRAAEVAGNSG